MTDLDMVKQAFGEVVDEIQEIMRQTRKVKSTAELVDLHGDLSALAGRYGALTRAVMAVRAQMAQEVAI